MPNVPKDLLPVPKDLLPDFSSMLPRLPDFGVDREAFQRLNEALAEAAEGKSAKGLVKRLVAEVRQFEAGVDDQHEVGIRLVSFGETLVVHVSEVGYIQPNLVTFAGATEKGEPVRLVQHMSQLSFLLMRVSRLDPEAPKKPIGFVIPDAQEP